MFPRSFSSVRARSLIEALTASPGRRVLAVCAGATVVVGLLGFQALDRPGARPVAPGDQLRIEVVRPVEPEITPGSVMEVGELVDGFRGLPASPPRTPEPDWLPANHGDEPALPPPRNTYRRAAVLVEHREATYPQPRRSHEDRWFGFDAPRRDYRAERELRRARYEAMARRSREEDEARRREWIARHRYADAPGRREWVERPRDMPPVPDRGDVMIVEPARDSARW